jgi:hypothetical protein
VLASSAVLSASHVKSLQDPAAKKRYLGYWSTPQAFRGSFGIALVLVHELDMDYGTSLSNRPQFNPILHGVIVI